MRARGGALPIEDLGVNSVKSSITLPYHLSSQNGIKNEAGDKAIEDQRIVDLLRRREDS